MYRRPEYKEAVIYKKGMLGKDSFDARALNDTSLEARRAKTNLLIMASNDEITQTKQEKLLLRNNSQREEHLKTIFKSI